MKLASILPIDRYTLVTKISETEVLKRLDENVEYRKNLVSMGVQRFGKPKDISKPYAGTIVGKVFEIARVINYKNSFLPMIKGEVSSFLGQTEIKIKMSTHVMIQVFTVIWMLFVLIACVVVSGIIINDWGQGPVDPTLFIPFAMVIFGLLLFTIPYKLEAKKSRKFLAELLEGEEVENK